MGRVIKLTESDLYRIVKRVISEQKTTNSGTLTDQQAVISLENCRSFTGTVGSNPT